MVGSQAGWMSQFYCQPFPKVVTSSKPLSGGTPENFGRQILLTPVTGHSSPLHRIQINIHPGLQKENFENLVYKLRQKLNCA